MEKYNETRIDTTENGQKKLKWSEKIAYGFGDFGNGFMFLTWDRHI
ncbi:MAG: hypothetical protein ACLRMN_08525 [Mediterraneibacter gnavus]